MTTTRSKYIPTRLPPIVDDTDVQGGATQYNKMDTSSHIPLLLKVLWILCSESFVLKVNGDPVKRHRPDGQPSKS